jgi:hypothetical protein
MKTQKIRDTGNCGFRHPQNFRERRSWGVVCSPWEGEPYLASRHASYAAARQRMMRSWRGFRANNPNGYGYKWEIAALVATPYCTCGPAWEIYED